MDTLEPMVPDPSQPDPKTGDVPVADVVGDGSEPHGRPRRRLKRRWYVLGATVVVITVAIVAAAMIKVPYYLLSPGIGPAPPRT